MQGKPKPGNAGPFYSSHQGPAARCHRKSQTRCLGEPLRASIKTAPEVRNLSQSLPGHSAPNQGAPAPSFPKRQKSQCSVSDTQLRWNTLHGQGWAGGSSTSITTRLHADGPRPNSGKHQVRRAPCQRRLRLPQDKPLRTQLMAGPWLLLGHELPACTPGRRWPMGGGLRGGPVLVFMPKPRNAVAAVYRPTVHRQIRFTSQRLTEKDRGKPCWEAREKPRGQILSHNTRVRGGLHTGVFLLQKKKEPWKQVHLLWGSHWRLAADRTSGATVGGAVPLPMDVAQTQRATHVQHVGPTVPLRRPLWGLSLLPDTRAHQPGPQGAPSRCTLKAPGSEPAPCTAHVPAAASESRSLVPLGPQTRTQGLETFTPAQRQRRTRTGERTQPTANCAAWSLQPIPGRALRAVPACGPKGSLGWLLAAPLSVTATLTQGLG